MALCRSESSQAEGLISRIDASALGVKDQGRFPDVRKGPVGSEWLKNHSDPCFFWRHHSAALAVGAVFGGREEAGLLPGLVKFTIAERDAMPWELGLRRTTPIGVFADLALSEAQVKTLHAQSDSASLEFTDAAGRPIKLPLSLRGLPQALDALGRE